MTAEERRPNSLRHYLVLLALAVAIPLVGLAFYVSYRVAAIEQQATRAALLNNARSLAAALDQEIDKHIAVAWTLAHSPLLLNGDWPEFDQWAKDSLADLSGSWLVVLDTAGQVLADTSAAPNAVLPRRALFAVEEQALATGKAEVSGVVTGFAADRMVAFAAIPVFRDGHPLYVVDITLSPERFVALLQEQKFLMNWLAAIVDSSGNFVARLPDEEGTKLGQSASEGWRNAIQHSPTGVVEHVSTDGRPIIDAYAQASYGWTVGIGIRQIILDTPLRRTLWLLLAASLGCIGLGLVFAWLVARRLNRSAKVLHDAAQAMAAEEPVQRRATGVDEYDEAVAAFAAASRVLQIRAQERDRAVQALRAHEAELEAVINRTPFMLTRCGRDLRYRFVSQGCAEMFGRKAEDIVGRPIAEIVGEEAFESMLPSVMRVLNGERVESESEIHYEGIGTRFIHVVATPERDEHGEVIGWVASILDITDRKRAEQERLRAEAALATSADEQAALYEFTNRLYRAESLKVVYDGALDAILRALHCSRASILRMDEHGVMRFVAWRGLSDAYRNAVDGHSPWANDETNPRAVCIDDIERSNQSDSIKAAVMQEGIRALSFIPLMSSDGRLSGKFMTYYEAAHAFTREQIDLALNLARRLGFAMERIEAEQARQVAEQELRKLKEKLETEVETRTLERDRIWNVSEDLLGVTNFEGYFVSINPAWTKLLGWTEDEIKSMHVSELRHPEDATAAMAGRAQLAQGVNTVRMENRFRHKDGSWRWIQWTMTAENGLIYVSGRHVTLEKEAAAALERANRRSAHSQKMEALGSLTGGVAHDFNNLLMIVSGHAQNLGRRLTDPKQLRALDAIKIASTRGESLTRQLLSFSRGMPLNPTVVSPTDTVQAIREVLFGSLHVNTELSIDVPESVWPVRVDKSELELALVNLTVNARDAMPDGGQLSISAENVLLIADDTPEGLSGDFVSLSVTDTGSGIADEVIGRVFEPFFTTKGADKGTGLGLSQVYGFARRSGGTAIVKSQLGRGTTVTIYLPRSHGRIEVPLVEDAAQYTAPAGTTVLVVEDNHEVRAVTVSLLEQLGYQTIAVENATAALEALAFSQPVSIIFSDVVLPGEIDGLLLARTVKVRHPDIPVVLTTGYTRVFEAEPEFPVLRKPYQISALGRIIREALDAGRSGKTALAS
jgi:PAS domain S-box-containing protein